MTLQDFKDNYYCKIDIVNNSKLIVTSTIHSKNDDVYVYGIKTEMDSEITSEWINDSHAPNSLRQWNIQDVVDTIKRSHMDCFAQKFQIKDFFPLNKETNPDIDIYYKK